MKKKVIAMLMSVTMIICTLTGCGSAETSQTTVESTTAETVAAETSVAESSVETTAEEQELNIAIFEGGYGEEYWNAVIDMFEASHAGVTVNMTISANIADIIRPEIVAGNAPDFISLNAGAEDGLILSMINDKALLDITDVFDGKNYAETATLRDDIKDGLLESTACAPYANKMIYLAPFNTGPQGLIYNANYFETNSLKTPETWDDFFALGDAAADRALFTYQGIYPGYMEEMLWPAIASACGPDAIKAICNYEEGSFNNEKVIAVLQKIADISAKGYLLDGTVGMTHTESQTAMMRGQSVFITNGTWMEGEMVDAPREDGFEFAMTTMPVMKSGDTKYVLDSCETFCIPASAPNADLAKEFLRFLYSDESVAAFAEKSGGVFATKTAREIAKQYISESTYNMYGIYDQDNTESLIMNWASLPADCKVVVNDEVFNPLTDVMNGDMTAEEWAASIEEAFAEIRAE